MIFTAFSRIHVNSIKMNSCGGYGGGGIGFSVRNPILKAEFGKSNKIKIECSNKKLGEITRMYAMKFVKKYNLPGCRIKVLQFFEPHHGLGSETQMALLIGRAFKKVYNLKIRDEEITNLLGVAGVSGVGYYSFFNGGFIVEAGYPMGKNCEKIDFSVHSSKPPILVSSYPFPKKMKILIIIPHVSPVDSFSRIEEDNLFKENTPVPFEEVGDISASVLTGLIPGIISEDYNQIVKNLMFISTLGTKKVELEINFNLIRDIQEKLSDLLEFKYRRKERACFSLVNEKNQNISHFVKGNEEISIKKPIPWLGLSSLGSALYSVLSISSEDGLENLKEEISKRVRNAEVIITEVRNEKDSF